MAYPTDISDRITDSVTQTNVEVLGAAPAIAMGNLYQATSQALGQAAHFATYAQQQGYIAAQAATIAGLGALYGLDAAAAGTAAADTLKKPSRF